ncbi:MAG: RNA 3'-terminal phosphate cyclase [Planctomycetota bacterium]
METITLDGRHGEGGGQILRSGLTLSLCTGRPLQLSDIRANRRKPGLMRQHFACVKAAMEISGGSADGAYLGSQELRFQPGTVRGGAYRFAVGSAGSASLVLQTILLPLLFAEEESVVHIEGGTHNAWAPTADFLRSTFLPVLRRMGVQADLELERVGFFPAGGGAIVVHVRPIRDALHPLDLLERGERLARTATIRNAHLAHSIIEKEAAALRNSLGMTDEEITIVQHPDSIGPGNTVEISLEYERITEVLTGFAERGVPARQVANGVAKKAQRFLTHDHPVGGHLADQLLLPMALLAGGRFRTKGLSKHFQTNVDVIHAFLPNAVKTTPLVNGNHLVEVKPL